MKMIKVAIVDDNEEDLKSAINYFVSYLKTNHSESGFSAKLSSE